MEKNIIIFTLAGLLAMSMYFNFTADYTMTQAQANRMQAPVKVFFAGAEDDLYIQPSDIGRVDLVPMPIPNR